MFEAAGLARIRLVPLLAAFFLGRLVSYSIYVGGASAAHDDLKRLFDRGLFSPQAIAIQVAGVVLMIVLVLIGWPSVIDKLRAF